MQNLRIRRSHGETLSYQPPVWVCAQTERERESDSMCGCGVCMQSEYKHRERAGIAMECMYSEARGNACISERDDILVYN